MKKTFLCLFLFFIFICGLAQNGSLDPPPPPLNGNGTVHNTSDTSEVFTFAEVMPDFPNGGLQKYLKENIKYPIVEKDRGIQGTVYISFVVEKDGSITNVHAVKEVPCAPGFTREGIKVISQMPSWTPGLMNGYPVRIEMKQPIRFVLTGDDIPSDCGKELTKVERIATCKCNPGTLPQFPGGDVALKRYFDREISLSNGTRKKWANKPCGFDFVIDTMGEVCDVHIHLIEKDDNFKNNLASVICGMPWWKSGSGADFVKMRVRMSGIIVIGETENSTTVTFEPMDLIAFHSKYSESTSGIDNSHAVCQPQFLGGKVALEKYIRDNLAYPETSKKAGIQGTVTLNFIVEMDGTIGFISATKEIPEAPELTKEAIRMVSAMPKWVPGKINGRLSRMPVSLDVKFAL